MNKIDRIKELIKLCNYHCNLYYVQDKPEISDFTYDDLYCELEYLEKETNYILSNSPTQKVQGEVLDCFKKVKHTEPMLSAEKSKDINDVIKFMKNEYCIISWKLDGLTIVLRYNKGILQQAITRGTGLEGEDVTSTVRTFANIPLTIQYQGYLEIRGEGLVTLKELNRINQELISKGEEPYSSARNLAAGSVRQLDANITKKRNLIFKAFGMIKCDEEFETKYKQFRFLEDQGFDVVAWSPFIYNNIIDLEERIKIFEDTIPTLDYLIDGLIFEYDNIQYGKSQGVTGHHGRNLFAYKFTDDTADTILRDIEWSVGRTGVITPVALFDEVELAEAKITRASLHNLSIMEELEIGILDKICLQRANGIIPQIVENYTSSNNIIIPEECPACGGVAIIDQPGNSKILYCTNRKCSARLLGEFSHFVSKNAMNIINLSEATLEKFINAGFLKTFDDIYSLWRYKDAIIKMDGFGIKSYDKLIDSINKSKRVKMASFIYSLGIINIGRTASKVIAEYFHNDYFEFAEAASSGFDFTELPDFGMTMCANVLNWYDDISNLELSNRLLDIIRFVKEEEKVMSEVKKNVFQDKVFCVTGSFENYKPRKLLEEIIESLGGKVTGSVSAKTNYLITNDTDTGTKKNQAAQKFGVEIINEDEFISMIK
jgi:DNA ligase (NAD+)